jgi:hypothetical protein
MQVRSWTTGRSASPTTTRLLLLPLAARMARVGAAHPPATGNASRCSSERGAYWAPRSFRLRSCCPVAEVAAPSTRVARSGQTPAAQRSGTERNRRIGAWLRPDGFRPAWLLPRGRKRRVCAWAPYAVISRDRSAAEPPLRSSVGTQTSGLCPRTGMRGTGGVGTGMGACRDRGAAAAGRPVRTGVRNDPGGRAQASDAVTSRPRSATGPIASRLQCEPGAHAPRCGAGRGRHLPARLAQATPRVTCHRPPPGE